MHTWKRKIIITTSAWTILFFLGTISRLCADTWVDATFHFHDEARVLAQTLKNSMRVAQAPAIVDIKPVYQVGDVREFFAFDVRNRDQYSLNASCQAVSDKAYIFVEEGKTVSFERIESLLNAFDRIYDAITDQFGPSPDSIDNDPRIYLLLLDIIADIQVDGASVMGYFNPINQYRNVEIPNWIGYRSNEIEMLYIEHTSLSRIPDVSESITAHEFTHLVQWGLDPEESTWIDEGIAVYAESVLGYDTIGRVSAFEDNPETSLLNWSGLMADYGAAYLFFAYISERFGGANSITTIMKNEARGILGIEQALASKGTPISFRSLFSDWCVANYLDKPEAGDGTYGYSTLSIDLKPLTVESQYPIERKDATASGWAAQYIVFEKEANDFLNLTIYGKAGQNTFFQMINTTHKDVNVLPIELNDNGKVTTLIPQGTHTPILMVTSQPKPIARRWEWLLKRNDLSYAYSANIQQREDVRSARPLQGKLITTWGELKSSRRF